MQMEFTDGYIIIRPYTIEGAVSLYEAASEYLPDGIEWLPWIHSDYSCEESREWIATSIEKWESRTEYNFAVISAATGEYLGGVGLNHIDAEYSIANLGYWVRKSMRGRGIALAAARLAAEFGFNQLELSRIEIIVAVNNTASCRTAEKAGAVCEGRLRNRLKIGGKPCDAIMHSFTPSDFDKAIK